MFKKILIAVDNTDLTQKVLDFAAALARNEETEFFLVNVVEEPPLLSDALREKAGNIYLPLSTEILKKAVKHLKAKGIRNLIIKSFSGDPGDIIAAYAEENNVDTIIIGRHRRSSLGRLFHKSVSDKVLNRVPCPVVVVQ